MDEIRYFVPGETDARSGEAGTIAARLRAPVPAGVAAAYVRAYTGAGDLVLIPYCQDAAVVRDVVAEGRRAVAVNFDPLMVLLTRVSLSPPPRRDLDAAVSRLGDSPKQDVPLRRYLERLYVTTCPACLRPAVASEFVWDRDAGVPVTKQLRCRGCSWDGSTAADAEDRTRFEQVQPRGMHYHFVLDRIAPRGTDARLRARLEKLLGLYPARTLYALAELTIKIEALFNPGGVQDALKVLLLDCLDRCAALAPVASPADRRGTARRRLALGPRFVERNVWLAFEEAVARFAASSGSPVDNLTADATVVQSGSGEWDAYVGQHVVRDIPRLLPPPGLPGHSPSLVIAAPPLLDPAAWSLAYLWGAWLLGTEAVAPLRPLLQQRTADARWYARGLGSSLRSFGSLVAHKGRIVFALEDRSPSTLAGLVTAAAAANVGFVSHAHSGAAHRLVLAPTPEPGSGPSDTGDEANVEPGDLDAALERAALYAAVETIRTRGEPVRWPGLQAEMWSTLAQAGLLAPMTQVEGPEPLDSAIEAVRRAREDGALLLLPAADGGEPFCWLTNPAGLSTPLSDRVEISAYELLQNSLALTEGQFASALYARFPGRLSPEPELVSHALRAYAYESSPGFWQLRDEDTPGARQAEQASVIKQIERLGRRLGYEVVLEGAFDVAWKEGGAWRSIFCVRWHAIISEVLSLHRPDPDTQPYLVLPGGRAALAAYKLSHNPIWQRAVDEAGWHFIKYRHVRQLAGEPEVDEYILRTIVGLDPIVEREGAQIPLF